VIDAVPVDRSLVLVALVIGVGTLAAAAWVATRGGAGAASSTRAAGLAPLVPWAGTLVVLVLLARGAIAGAVVIGLLTVAHAVVTRVRAIAARRRPRPARPSGGSGPSRAGPR
jgi:hypothetical protein